MFRIRTETGSILSLSQSCSHLSDPPPLLYPITYTDFICMYLHVMSNIHGTQQGKFCLHYIKDNQISSFTEIKWEIFTNALTYFL